MLYKLQNVFVNLVFVTNAHWSGWTIKCWLLCL